MNVTKRSVAWWGYLTAGFLASMATGWGAARLEPLGWQPGEEQAYFLEVEQEPSDPQPCLLYVYQYRTGTLSSLPLTDLAIPFCRETAGEIPDRHQPGDAWIQSVRRSLKPFRDLRADHLSPWSISTSTLSAPLQKGQGLWRTRVLLSRGNALRLSVTLSSEEGPPELLQCLDIPGMNRVFLVYRAKSDGGKVSSERLAAVPPMKASGVAMDGQVYSIELARAERPGILSTIRDWVKQAEYLPYILQTESHVYRLRAGCFVGHAVAEGHAKKLEKTLGMVRLEVVNRHAEWQDAHTLEAGALHRAPNPSNHRGEFSMTRQWWFWAGVIGVIGFGALALMAFLRMGGDSDESLKTPPST